LRSFKKNVDRMKISVSVRELDLDAEVESRFGRDPYFVVVDSETMAWAEGGTLV